MPLPFPERPLLLPVLLLSLLPLLLLLEPLLLLLPEPLLPPEDDEGVGERRRPWVAAEEEGIDPRCMLLIH